MVKPRILYLVQLPPPVHGASEMNRMVFDSEVVNEGFEKRVIPLNFSTKLSQLQHFSIIKVFKAFGIFFQLLFDLITYRPRIVYFSMVPFGPILFRDGLYLILIRIFGAAPVAHLHRPGLHRVKPTRLNRFVYKNLFRGCKVVHLSPQLVERELIPLGLNPENLFSFPNTVDFEPIQRPIREKAINILFLSNLYPHKGFFKLIEAFALVANKFPDLKLTIAGYSPDPSIPQKIFDLTKLLRLEGRVTYIGGVEREQRNSLYYNADIFVLPSESEYFPLVILEAMLAGVPVICTGKENIGCYFEDGKDLLFLSNPPSVKEIAEKLYLLISDEKLRTATALNGSARVSQINRTCFSLIRKLFVDCTI
jgi:Glycosyltransferase